MPFLKCNISLFLLVSGFNASFLCLLLNYLVSYNAESESYAETNNIVAGLKTDAVRDLMLAGMAIFSHMLLTAVIGNLDDLKQLVTVRGPASEILVISSLLLPIVVIFHANISISDYHIVNCVLNIRHIILACTVCWYISEHGGSIFKSRLTYIAISLCCIGGVLQSAFGYVNEDELYIWLNNIGYVASVLASLLCIIICSQWLLFIKNLSNKHISNTDHYKCTVYVVYFTSYIISCWIIGAICNVNNADEMNESFIIAYITMSSIYTISLSMCLSRIAKNETISYKEQLEFKRMFVNYISHEIRTPLNTAIMGLQFLEEEMSKYPSTSTTTSSSKGIKTSTKSSTSTSMNSEHLDALRDIKISNEIAVNVLNELLTFDKLEAGTVILERTEFLVLDWVKTAVRPFYIQARQCGVNMSISVKNDNCIDNNNYNNNNNNNNDDGIFNCYSNESGHLSSYISDNNISTTTTTSIYHDLTINGDINKLSQVMRNLISNALKFTPMGGTVTVEISLVITDENRHSVRISVTDTGAGISQENQKRLFKEIVQFNPGQLQKGGGSGLGLYNMHGGQLSVYSPGEGHGCTFTVELPITTRHAKLITNTNTSINTASNQPLSLLLSLPSLSSSQNVFTRRSTVMPSPASISNNFNNVSMEIIDDNNNNYDNHNHDGEEAFMSGIVVNIELTEAPTTATTISSKKQQQQPYMQRSSLSTSSSSNISLSLLTQQYTINKSNIINENKGDINVVFDKEVDDEEEEEKKNKSDNNTTATLTTINTINNIYSNNNNNNNNNNIQNSKNNDKNKTTNRDIINRKLTKNNSTQLFRVLVVDDSVMSRKMQCRLLRSRCSECVEAEDGLEAIEQIKASLSSEATTATITPATTTTSGDDGYGDGGDYKEEEEEDGVYFDKKQIKRNGNWTFDVILMDSEMPNMNGSTATQIIRQMGYKGLIIGVTGNVSSEDIDSFVSAGVDVVLPKPFNIVKFDKLMEAMDMGIQ